VKRTFWILCTALIIWYLAAAESWRLFPPDPTALEAATVQKKAIAAVRTERLARNIPIDLETDRNDTGLIGDDYTGLTSTLGNLAAKRSAATPEAAALLVCLLREAGVSKGSLVAVNASGSFPGFVLAAIAACGALQANAVIIVSLGASTWGANRFDFTIVDMILAAIENGAFPPGYPASIAAISPGGADDRGLDLEYDLLEGALARMAKYGLNIIRPTSLADSIASRMVVYSKAGKPDVLLTIGGNYASTGVDSGMALLSGVITPSCVRNANSIGLVQEFLRAGKPVIQILNIEELFFHYGVLFDPIPVQPVGKSKIYRDRRMPTLVLLAPALVMLVGYGLIKRKL